MIIGVPLNSRKMISDDRVESPHVAPRVLVLLGEPGWSIAAGGRQFHAPFQCNEATDSIPQGIERMIERCSTRPSRPAGWAHPAPRASSDRSGFHGWSSSTSEPSTAVPLTSDDLTSPYLPSLSVRVVGLLDAWVLTEDGWDDSLPIQSQARSRTVCRPGSSRTRANDPGRR